MSFDVDTFNVPEFDRILSRGLSNGLGTRDGKMCIEAAICTVLGLPHSDNPQCVAESVRAFKIRLNDSKWSSPAARAAGMRDLGLAQLGSIYVVDDEDFIQRVGEQTIKILIPHLFRSVFAGKKEMLEHADKCESADWADAACAADAAGAAAHTAARAAEADAYAARVAARAAGWAAEAANAANDLPVRAATYAAYAAYYAACSAVEAARKAAYAAKAGDTYLIMSAQIALGVLKELGSPGCKLLSL